MCRNRKKMSRLKEGDGQGEDGHPINVVGKISHIVDIVSVQPNCSYSLKLLT